VGRHFPDMWLDFAVWHTRPAVGGGGKDAALAVLDRGCKVSCCHCDFLKRCVESCQQVTQEPGKGRRSSKRM